jgi:hypothetical protein
MYQRKIAECDTQIEAHLLTFDSKIEVAVPLSHPSVGLRKPDATNRTLIYTPNSTASAAWT